MGNGFRMDHIFSTLELDQHIKHVGYDHNPRHEKETDHSSMFVEIEDYCIYAINASHVCNILNFSGM